jgi:glycosyltransferase involved in cell wall biosynthesis
VLLEQDYEETNVLLNSARVGVNCADYWGGGQRSTLECMAAGLPVVVMEDSPKNREFVEESGIGAVVPPDPNMIRLAVEGLKNNRRDTRAYVMKKWTPEHYKNAILNAL